jgi:putative ABC transport system substrate-binding protein
MQPEGTTLGIFLAMAVSAPGFAQAAMTKIGFLSPAIAPTHAAPNAALDAFRQGLADLGYVKGRDFTIEARWGSGRDDQLPVLAAELVGEKGGHPGRPLRERGRARLSAQAGGSPHAAGRVRGRRLSGGNNPDSRRAA